jgi:hydroxymethylpyrimidine pyrophosphatase-like HAD family hydrolase
LCHSLHHSELSCATIWFFSIFWQINSRKKVGILFSGNTREYFRKINSDYMPLTEEQHHLLQNFFNQSNFVEEGGVITDLDGTAVHEYQSKIVIPEEVEMGLKKIHDLGRPVVINTLRFPLSVMRTFGREWYNISRSPVPTVLMNGSQLGYMVETKDGNLAYEEITAFPLTETEKDEVLKTVRQLIADSITEPLVFYYPRDWTQGEIIWTPASERISIVQNKYTSASLVYSSDINKLADDLKSQDICMIFLLIDVVEDKLMAYQHTKKNNFFTHEGIDKLTGAEQIASKINFSLPHSLGAGDTDMDVFLSAVGLAVHVGNPYLNFESVLPPIKIKGSPELGELLFELSAMQRTVVK